MKSPLAFCWGGRWQLWAAGNHPIDIPHTTCKELVGQSQSLQRGVVERAEGLVVAVETREGVSFCSLCGNLLEFCSFRASKRVQQVRVLAANPEGLSLNLRTHVVEGEN